MIYGAILAGGIGSRMQMGEMPKQFLLLGDKPIIIHTLEKFLLCPKFDEIYIGIHPDWVLHMQDLLQTYGYSEKAKLVPGGGDRNETIIHIVNAILAQRGEHEEDIIVTHDSVRPFVTMRILEENIEAALAHRACDTVIPAVDTIVVSKDSQFIAEIPNRSAMYQGQTPQSFQISLLKRLYEALTPKEKEMLTDACKICVVRDVPVYLVKGETANLKITIAADLKIAQAIVGGVKLD